MMSCSLCVTVSSLFYWTNNGKPSFVDIAPLTVGPQFVHFLCKLNKTINNTWTYHECLNSAAGFGYGRTIFALTFSISVCGLVPTRQFKINCSWLCERGALPPLTKNFVVHFFYE